MNPFVKIYKVGGWDGIGSGRGSHPYYTEGYRTFLEEFLRRHEVRSVVDFGCGDWAFSSLVDWNGATYLGMDCVPDVIQSNKSRYEGENVRFQCVEFGDFTIPPCDLLISKDMLQHLSNQHINEFLEQTRKTKLVLLANDFSWGENVDIRDGQHRHLDLTKPPFCERGEVVYAFRSIPDEKIVLLQRNG